MLIGDDSSSVGFMMLQTARQWIPQAGIARRLEDALALENPCPALPAALPFQRTHLAGGHVGGQPRFLCAGKWVAPSAPYPVRHRVALRGGRRGGFFRPPLAAARHGVQLVEELKPLFFVVLLRGAGKLLGRRHLPGSSPPLRCAADSLSF